MLHRQVMRLFAILLFSLVLSACHEGDSVFHWVTPETVVVLPTTTPQPVAPIDSPDVVPEEEVGLEQPDPTPTPPCTVVKANIARDGRKLYHLPGMPNYEQVKIDEPGGEKFFCSEQEAIDAGWVKARN